MSFDDYEEARIGRENRAEEMARAIYASQEKLYETYYAVTYQREPLTWNDLPDHAKGLWMAVAHDLMDSRKVAPWSMVQSLENKLQGIKNIWKDLNEVMK